MRVAFDINRCLSRFFTSPSAFRSLQARTGTLISGSIALQFLDRVRYHDTGTVKFHGIVHNRLIHRSSSRLGYTRAQASPSGSRSLVAALWVSLCPRAPSRPRFRECYLQHHQSIAQRVSRARRDCDHVQVCEGNRRGWKYSSADGDRREQSNGDSTQHPFELSSLTCRISKVWLTNTDTMHMTACTMNIITFRAAYCLFPQATLEERRSLLSSSNTGIYRNRGQALAKYMQRGFEIVFHIPTESFTCNRPSFPLGWRWIDDENSWVIPLDTSDVVRPAADIARPGRAAGNSPPPCLDPSSICNWHLKYGPSKGVNVHFSVMKSDVLKYRYIISDPELSAHLSHFMGLLLREEHHSQGLPPGDVLYVSIWVVALTLTLLHSLDPLLPRVCRNFVRSVAARRLSCMRWGEV